MTDPRSFGAWLQRERERRGVTLRAISDRTKIGAPLLESLERGDVSRWPGGIYRRSFVRAYADAVGVDVDLVLANFERFFPEDGPAPRPAAPILELEADEPTLRLQLAAARSQITSAAVRAACLDAGVILAAGLAGLAVAGAAGFWCGAALTAVAFHTTGVLGLRTRGAQGRTMVARPASQLTVVERPPASVVSFSEEQGKSMSRKARAKKMAAAFSHSALAAAAARGRRALRS